MSAVGEVLFGKLSRLRNVYRYSGEYVLQRENVAEHSFWTALIAVTIAMEYWGPTMAKDVAVRALLHDIEESMTGDLVRSMKYHDQNLRDQIASVETEFAASLLAPLGEVGEEYFHIWFNAKNMETDSGKIVALADLLCVISYCRKEAESGNPKLAQIEADCEQLIEDKFGHDSLFMRIVREATT